MPQRHILIVGVEFNNQGAYLMMLAAAQQIRERFDAIPVVEFQNGTETQKRRAGVYALVPRRSFKAISRMEKIKRLSRLWSKFPLVTPSQVSAVFDGSGFQYGDQWVDQPLDYTSGKLSAWKSRGVPVYMLPQAFGPFEKTRSAGTRAVASSRLVFPRDPDSLRYVESLQTGVPTSLYPDFTTILKGQFPSEYEQFRGGVPIIPNWNIYARASEAEQRAYVTQLASIAAHVTTLGMQAYGLSHEGAKDVRVLEMVRDEVKSSHHLPLEIVKNLEGLQLKGLIGTAPFIVSGRFHAIVSALSQGVPAIIHGWSHKYAHLAADFGVSQLITDPYGPPEEARALVDSIVDDTEIRPRIQSAGKELKSRTTEMWDTVARDFATFSRS